MRRFGLALVIASLCGGAAYADFVGPWAPANWAFFTDCDGSGALTVPQMDVIGGDNEVPGFSEWRITVPPGAHTLSWNWTYWSDDVADWDWAYYSVDDVRTEFVRNETQGSGSVAGVVVGGGQVFAIGVYTEDGWFGAGNLRVTNFVPEPAALALLVVGALSLRRR